VGDDGASTVAVTADTLRLGQLVVLSTGAGCYTASGWDPTQPGVEVRDLSPRLRGVLHLTVDALQAATGEPVPDDLAAWCTDLVRTDDDTTELISGTVTDELSAWLTATGVFPDDLTGLQLELPPGGTHAVARWQRARLPYARPALDALDELSTVDLVDLGEHLTGVGDLAGRLAGALGLDTRLLDAVRQAGQLHDLGKSDRRFQRWLGNTAAAPPIAKSSMNAARWEAARVAAGWPRGGRHELLSDQLIDAAVAAGVGLVDDDLVRHLVLSHHGQGRPWVTAAGPETPLRTTATVAGITVSTTTDPARVAGEQPDRFARVCERYGYWGVALLETIVRQADHLVSAVTEVD
jgi:CRISPR-associated endonuclease/helicase Cas3